MAELVLEGMDRIMNRIEEMGRKGVSAQSKGIKAGAQVLQDEIDKNAPRSDSPKRATPKESWRTGQHAADHVKISRVKTKNGVKYVDVGWLKSDNSPFFYMKFQNWGTSRMPHPPHEAFIEKSVASKEQEALHEMRNVFSQELGL